MTLASDILRTSAGAFAAKLVLRSPDLDHAKSAVPKQPRFCRIPTNSRFAISCIGIVLNPGLP
jgi:hypothetical protein